VLPFIGLAPSVAALAPGDPLAAVLILIIAMQAGLIGWFVRLVLTGRLVPGNERDYWREFAFEEQRQKAQLMVTARVVEGVVTALPDAPPGGGTT
jgi:hypothetical protein